MLLLTRLFCADLHLIVHILLSTSVHLLLFSCDGMAFKSGLCDVSSHMHAILSMRKEIKKTKIIGAVCLYHKVSLPLEFSYPIHRTAYPDLILVFPLLLALSNDTMVLDTGHFEVNYYYLLTYTELV